MYVLCRRLDNDSWSVNCACCLERIGTVDSLELRHLQTQWPGAICFTCETAITAGLELVLDLLTSRETDLVKWDASIRHREAYPDRFGSPVEALRDLVYDARWRLSSLSRGWGWQRV